MESSTLIHPLHSPLSFFSHNINVSYSIKEILLLDLIFDVCVNQKRVCFWVNVFHRYLESIETTRLRYLNLSAELLTQIFWDDSIWGREKGKYMSDEVFFLFVEFLPILGVLREVDLICSPKWGKMLFVHFKDGVVLDGEEDKPLRILLKKGFSYFCFSVGWSHIQIWL